MNLDSLKNMKFDVNALKNFSVEDVRNFINEQQVLALNIVIGLGAVIAGLVVINMRIGEYSELKLRLDELTAKEEPAHKYDKLLKKKRDFLRAVPSTLSEEDVIPYLTNLADKHSVVITELQPPYEKVEGFYREVRIVFGCSVSDFHDILAFVNDMEGSKYMLKINSWSVSPQKKDRDANDPRIKQGYTVVFDISSMRLMENDKKN